MKTTGERAIVGAAIIICFVAMIPVAGPYAKEGDVRFAFSMQRKEFEQKLGKEIIPLKQNQEAHFKMLYSLLNRVRRLEKKNKIIPEASTRVIFFNERGEEEKL